MDKIHIRHQNNGRGIVASIEGLPLDLDYTKILDCLKKKLACGGFVDSKKNVIVLMGDKCFEIRRFLLENNITDKNSISVHCY